jgi:hypothetical protein
MHSWGNGPGGIFGGLLVNNDDQKFVYTLGVLFCGGVNFASQLFCCRRT